MKSAEQPAFPQSTEDLTKVLGNGLTKRECFAAMAMQSYAGIAKSNGHDDEQIARHSIALADELLKQLES